MTHVDRRRFGGTDSERLAQCSGDLAHAWADQHAVSWKVYQNAADNYDDNTLAYFTQFSTAPAGSPLTVKGMGSVPPVTGSTPDDIAAAIRSDVLAGTLLQVSWVVSDMQSSEHPSGAPADGAHFIHMVMDALNSDRTPSTPRSCSSTTTRTTASSITFRAHRPGRHRRRVLRRHQHRPRLSRPHGRHLPLDARRLGQLRGLRPHLRPALPRTLDSCHRQARDLPQHLRLAP